MEWSGRGDVWHAARDQEMWILENRIAACIRAADGQTEEFAVFEMKRWVKHFFFTDCDLWNEDPIEFLSLDTDKEGLVGGKGSLVKVGDDALSIDLICHFSSGRVDADANSCGNALRNSAQVRRAHEANEDSLVVMAQAQFDFKCDISLRDLEFCVVKTCCIIRFVTEFRRLHLHTVE